MASSINKYSVVESLNQMIYESATAVAAVDGGSGATGDQTLPDSHTALYVGVGGDVVLTLQSGSDATFKNYLLSSLQSKHQTRQQLICWH